MNAARTTWTKVTRFRGDTARIPFRLTDELGAIYNPTGKILIFTAKATATDPDTAALVQKISTVGGIYIVDATAGLVHVELVSADYAVLAVGGEYPCDLQGQDPDTGAVTTVGRIVLAIAQDITQETTLSIPTHTTEPSPPGTGAGDMLKSENLAGLADIVEARDNLGLGTAATQDVGTAAGTVAAGNDGRLSDARTPTAHTHPIAQVTGLADALTAKADASAVATALAAKADSSAVASALAEKVDDDDTRLSDARTPLAHMHAIADVTGLSDALAAKADDDDSRLSDARTPTAHAASHASGGGDAIVLAQAQVTGLSGALDLKADASAVATALAATEAAAEAYAVQRANHTGTQSADTLVDGSTNKAYTAAEQTKLAGLSAFPAVIADSTTARTLALADISKWIRTTNAGAIAITIPAQDDVAWPDDAETYIEQAGAGVFTVSGPTGVTVNGALNSAGQYTALGLKRVAEDVWTVIGGVA